MLDPVSEEEFIDFTKHIHSPRGEPTERTARLEQSATFLFHNHQIEELMTLVDIGGRIRGTLTNAFSHSSEIGIHAANHFLDQDGMKIKRVALRQLSLLALAEGTPHHMAETILNCMIGSTARRERYRCDLRSDAVALFHTCVSDLDPKIANKRFRNTGRVLLDTANNLARDSITDIVLSTIERVQPTSEGVLLAANAYLQTLKSGLADQQSAVERARRQKRERSPIEKEWQSASKVLLRLFPREVKEFSDFHQMPTSEYTDQICAMVHSVMQTSEAMSPTVIIAAETMAEIFYRDKARLRDNTFDGQLVEAALTPIACDRLLQRANKLVAATTPILAGQPSIQRVFGL